MKLRLCGNSVRLRLLRAEVAAFLESGSIVQTTNLGPGDDATWTYGLQHAPMLETIEVRHDPRQLVVLLPTAQATAWAETNQVGIYVSLALGKDRTLAVLIEKDFACLDRSDAENRDTFPHPQVGTPC